MEIREIGRSKQKSVSSEKRKELFDKAREEHSKLVKGKFEFVDAGGGWIEFNYRFFPEDLLVTYKFIHNEICEIPMGIVKHINNTITKVRTLGTNNGSARGNELPSRGVPSTYEATSRIRFIPVDVL